MVLRSRVSRVTDRVSQASSRKITFKSIAIVLEFVQRVFEDMMQEGVRAQGCPRHQVDLTGLLRPKMGLKCGAKAMCLEPSR